MLYKQESQMLKKQNKFQSFSQVYTMFGLPISHNLSELENEDGEINEEYLGVEKDFSENLVDEADVYLFTIYVLKHLPNDRDRVMFLCLMSEENGGHKLTSTDMAKIYNISRNEYMARLRRLRAKLRKLFNRFWNK